MAQSNSYPRDPVIKDKDVFSGTQFATLRTVNFTAQAVADYLNINGKVSIGGQMTFKFVTLTPGNGTISFPLGGGDNTPFSAITSLVVSTTDMSTQNVVNFLNYIVDSEILLTEQSHISTFGNYKITGYAITANPNFYDLTLEYVGGFGNITQDLYYDLTFFRSEGGVPPVIPTKTSDLINDGEDGIHPFITAQDIPNALIFTSPLVDTAGTITINQSGLSSDGYLSSIDWNTFNGKENVLTFSSPLVRTIDAISIPKASDGINGYLSGSDWTTFMNKQSALLGTGFVKSNAGVISYDTNTYYLASNPDGFITSAALTGYVPYSGATSNVDLGTYEIKSSKFVTNSGTSLQFVKGDGSLDSTTYLSSVGLTMPVAFTVSNTPLTANGTIAVGAAGLATQYIRGDGQLATFPATGGGGSSVNYYLNGSIPSTVPGYFQMDNDAVIGLGTDFSLTGNGLIAQFITDIGNPNIIEIPGGAWNFEMYFNISSVGGNTKFYVDLLKYDGVSFTLIATGATNPEEITGGTTVDLYLTSLAVPTTTLLVTDRLAVRVYIVDNSGGRTATLHTEDNNLCEVLTTLARGVTSINGLTASTQYLAVGTSGMDFNISSVIDTHTFNLPTASSVNRGALSSTDWTAFNSKASASGTTNYVAKFTGTSSIGNSLIFDNGTNIGIGTTSPNSLLQIGNLSTSDPLLTLGVIYSTNRAARGGIVWRDSSNITGKIFTEYDGNQVSMNFGSLYNSGYNSNTLMTIRGNGNVGIGTLTPNFKLNLYGSAALYNIGTNSTAVANTNYYIGHGLDNSTHANITSKIGFISDAGPGDFSDAITFYTTPTLSLLPNFDISTERMRITNAGYVGIGTSNPQKPLHVYGDIMLETALGTETIWMSGGAAVRYTGGYLQLQNSIYINSSNSYVGIAVSSPTARLHIAAQGSLSTDIAFKVRDATDTDDMVSINGTGNVLIGTNTDQPSSKLTIGGNTQGFLPPRLSTLEKNAIVSPATGLEVYDTTLGVLSQYDGSVWNNYQKQITLTTTGTSGASTLIGSTLNIPQYNGGGGGVVGLHSLIPLASGAQTAAVVNGGNLSNSASVANQMRANPYIPNQSFVSSNFYINVSLPLAGALGRIAVYSDLNGLPNSQLYLSSNLDLSTSGIKTAAVSFNFVAGTTYWLCLHTSAIVTIGIISPTNTVCLKILTTSIMLTITNTATFASGTPVTFGTSTYATNPAFFIGITK